MKNWIKTHSKLLVLCSIGGLGGFLIILVAIFTVLFFSNNRCSDNAGTSDTDISSGFTGSWTTQGTEAYKNAKATFDFWVSKGMSGAQAAGIVGNIGGAEDTGFVLNQKEIGGGSGGGLYQFTPYTKYLNDAKSDKSWSVVNQGEVVMSLEPQTVKSFFSKTKNSSPGDAATDWMNMYERPSERARATTNSMRRSAAEKAYELFGGANISAKDSLLGDVTETSDVGVTSDLQNDSKTCSVSSDSASDGTGEVPKGVRDKIYAANEIPDSLKPYLLPINVSDARGVSGKGWSHPGGQCVDYVVSEATVLWNNTQSWSLGNGVDQVNSAIKFGYAVKDDKPHKGDLVSCDGTDPSIGHTWMVGHVFADGSVLLQEQNYPGKSGDDMGAPLTWDVAVLPPYKDGAWANLPNYGATLNHPVFAKPAHGMKK